MVRRQTDPALLLWGFWLVLGGAEQPRDTEKARIAAGAHRNCVRGQCSPRREVTSYAALGVASNAAIQKALSIPIFAACWQADVPGGLAWLAEIQRYEETLLGQRE